jgi:hypothetical protein
VPNERRNVPELATPPGHSHVAIAVEELLSGKKPNMPPSLTPYFQAATFIPTDQPLLDL